MQVVLTVGQTQLRKKNLWLHWEKAVHRPLFALANTLHFIVIFIDQHELITEGMCILTAISDV